jgi:hypothetical protein
MMIPAGILDIFAAIMLVVAGVSCVRLIVAWPWPHRAADAGIDAAHVLMALAMAGMLAGGLRTLPDAAWAAVFAVVTAWLAWRVAAETRQRRAQARGTGHHLPHLVHGAAMIYMFLATTPAPAAGPVMAGMAAGPGLLRLPTLGLVFALLMAGWAVWDLDQLSGSVSVPAARGQRVHGLTTSGVMPGWPSAAVTATVATTGAAIPAIAGRAGPSGRAGTDPRPGTRPRDTAVCRDPAGPGLLDPRIAVASRIALGVTMTLMLVVMI